MMLILHHISQGSFKIMSDASHEPYHRNPLSQRRIPGFHARFQLRDILLTGFYILDIRYEIVLVKSMEVTQYHPIQCHRLIQFITAVLIFLSLCYLLRNKRTDGSQKTVCQRFTIHLVDDTGIIQSRPLQKPLFDSRRQTALEDTIQEKLAQDGTATFVTQNIPQRRRIHHNLRAIIETTVGSRAQDAGDARLVAEERSCRSYHIPLSLYLGSRKSLLQERVHPGLHRLGYTAAIEIYFLW